MEKQLAIPLTDFPQFWGVLSGICFILAIYLGYIGYRRYQGKGTIYPNELIFIWIYKLLKGRDKSNQIKRQILKNAKQNKILGLSTIIGAIGSLILSILLLIGAIFIAK